jgi:hypothetical protein
MANKEKEAGGKVRFTLPQVLTLVDHGITLDMDKAYRVDLTELDCEYILAHVGRQGRCNRALRMKVAKALLAIGGKASFLGRVIIEGGAR